MRHATAVIGANYGDEGKGLITDWLSCRPGALVVRFNGGAQAGHTVVEPSGRRHVFSHFGAGTLARASTFLSRFFVVHPIMFVRELMELHSKGVTPRVYADYECMVTTPWDMKLNQDLERSRGDGRHGSCGMGLGETVDRSERSIFGLKLKHLFEPTSLRWRLQQIRDYSKMRAAGYGLTMRDTDGEETLEHFMTDCALFCAKITPCTWAEVDSIGWADIIFEGAQGLLLDQADPRHFPHVTRSSTGLGNAATLAAEVGITDLHAWYVSRTYLTRHGAGPMDYEVDHPPHPRIKDETNIPNPHQGTLRFGLLCPEGLAERIVHDAPVLPTGLRRHVRFALTCADQVDERGMKIEGNVRMHTRDFMQKQLKMMDTKFGGVISWGPTRETMEIIL